MKNHLDGKSRKRPLWIGVALASLTITIGALIFWLFGAINVPVLLGIILVLTVVIILSALLVRNQKDGEN